MHDDMKNKLRTESYREYARMSQKLQDEKLSDRDRAWHEGNMNAFVNTVATLTGMSPDAVLKDMKEGAQRYREETLLPLMKIIWANEGTVERPKKWDDLFEYPVNDSERARIMERLSRSAKAVLEYCTDLGGTEEQS